jgi:indole-3-glycerol phosphate synthase
MAEGGREDGWLARILAAKQTEVERLRQTRLPAGPAPRPLELKRIPGGPLHLIAEIKRRSPSAGELSAALTVPERARSYERGGASLVSVLTDGEFFAGSFAQLAEARSACSLPLLCKDFVIDELQLDAARAFGADAVLLIVRCLARKRVSVLLAEARARELEPLVEVTTEQEAELALDAGARLIGVNARDLDTLVIDRERAARVLAGLPGELTAVFLSGLATPEQVGAVARTRADAALIGEALMRQADPEPLLRSLSEAARIGA